MKINLTCDIDGSKIITDLPDPIDPVALIEKKMKECPICGNDENVLSPPWYNIKIKKADKRGIHHFFLFYLNKYTWNKYMEMHCTKCGCTWDTVWFPVDNEMFEIKLDNKEIYTGGFK